MTSLWMFTMAASTRCGCWQLNVAARDADNRRSGHCPNREGFAMNDTDRSIRSPRSVSASSGTMLDRLFHEAMAAADSQMLIAGADGDGM